MNDKNKNNLCDGENWLYSPVVKEHFSIPTIFFLMKPIMKLMVLAWSVVRRAAM